MTPAAALVRRAGTPLLLSSLVGGVIAAFLAARQPPIVEVVQSFVVPLAEAQGTRPDQGNPVEATDLFVGTLTGWLTSPDFVAKAYERARVGGAPSSVRSLSRAFVAQRRGGQVVDVRFQAALSADAQALARAVREEVAERASALTKGPSTPAFRVMALEPLVLPVRPQPLLRGLVAFIVLFFLGLNLVFFADFLRTPRADLSPPEVPRG